MSGEGSVDESPFVSIDVDYSVADRLRLAVIYWPGWLLGPVSAMAAFLFVSLLFRLSRGDPFAEAVSDLPYGLSVILGVTFLAVRAAFDLVPLVWELLFPEPDDPEAKVTFGLSDDGLSVDSKRISSTLRWEMFEAVRSTPDRLYYVLSRRNVLMVPRRCFEDDGQFDRWRDFTESRIRQDKESR